MCFLQFEVCFYDLRVMFKDYIRHLRASELEDSQEEKKLF